MTFELGDKLLRLNQASEARPSSFHLLGREWDLLDGVFAPVYCFSTRLFASWIPYREGGSLLEIGSGTGVVAVTAALNGCSRVTAVDISAAAVENTRRNALRHGVEDRVRTLRSDLFAALDQEDRYDTIFWNSSFIDPPADHVQETDLHRAIFDPGYQAHRAYLRDAARHLAPGGRLLLGFSNLGNYARLRTLAEEEGLEIVSLESSGTTLVPGVEYRLLELVSPRGK